ncbi:hypothetical protein J5U22_01590 [Saccharolobus shibatae]|uniref:Uncharacterized protein n=1 Tax=Saccharolobus shibatae TaxID=2286 RepID=A0A8F5C0Y5_9CREN|nr:hypothetical protein J5U22_01590 [Saccharolobus shibatae]
MVLVEQREKMIYRVYKLHDKSVNIDIDEKIMKFIKGWASKSTLNIVNYKDRDSKGTKNSAF